MSSDISSKLNRLLSFQPLGVVLCSSWLVENGYSLDLQQRYKKSQWFESIGAGALIRYGDRVDYLGGVYAMQAQLGLSLHPGGKTALGLQGKAHYLELSPKHVQLFGTHGEHVPLWFKKQDWSVNVKCTLSSFLPAEIGLTEIPHKQFTVKVSEPARAIMECLYLAPKSQSLLEAYELMESLNNPLWQAS